MLWDQIHVRSEQEAPFAAVNEKSSGHGFCPGYTIVPVPQHGQSEISTPVKRAASFPAQFPSVSQHTLRLDLSAFVAEEYRLSCLHEPEKPNSESV